MSVADTLTRKVEEGGQYSCGETVTKPRLTRIQRQVSNSTVEFAQTEVVKLVIADRAGKRQDRLATYHFTVFESDADALYIKAEHFDQFHD